MPAPAMTYKKLRRQLDDLGYYQPLVPEASPLVEALLHDLLATTHNLKKCKEEKYCQQDIQKPSKNDDVNQILKEKETESSRVLGLQKKIKDLELLYQESLGVIKNLHCEIEERNAKILKLELSHNVQIVTEKNSKPMLSKPRIEMTSLVSSSSGSSSGPTYDNVPTSDNNQNNVDVIKIYAEKNKTLEKEVKKLQSELKTTTELLANVEKYWTQQAISGDNNKKPANIQNIQMPAENADPTQSSYAVQLLRQNEKLKEKLNQLESQAPVCFHGNCVPPNAPPGYNHCCPEGQIRSSIEQSHANLQNQQHHLKSQIISSRLKKHPSTSVRGPSYSDKVAQKTHQHMDYQHMQIHELQGELRKLHEDNRELTRRVNELSKIRQNLKEKNVQLEKQNEILLKNTNGKKVSEILGYVDKQRSMYRNNVKQLLNKLDPKGRALEEFEKYDEDLKVNTIGPSTKVNLNVMTTKTTSTTQETEQPKIIRTNPYSPSAYKSDNSSGFQSDNDVDILKREKTDLEAKFYFEKQELLTKIASLEEEILVKQHQLVEAENKIKHTVGSIRDDKEISHEKYQKDVHAFIGEIKKLEYALDKKQEIIQEFSKKKDLLHQQLDDKTERIENLKQRLLESENRKVTIESESTGQMSKLQDCLNEIERLQKSLHQKSSKLEQLQARLEGEQELTRELRVENIQLKTEMSSIKSDSDSKDEKIEDLRSHIRRYTTEVKRIEELLAMRERERTELLNQYKHLNDEVETSVNYGRQLESRVSDLQMEIKTKDQEIKASETRLVNMEQDLIEMSMANDEYRSKVANLSTRVDIAETEMRALRTEGTWLDTDTIDIQKLNEELTLQKEELQRLIAKQDIEIEQMTQEITELKSELDRLQKVLVDEQQSRNQQFEREKHNTDR